MKHAGLQEADTQNYLVSICCHDRLQFDLQSDEDLWWGCDHTIERQRNISKSALDILEKAIGMTYNIDGLMPSLQLRQYLRPSSTVYDPMHSYCSNGIAGVEVHLFLQHAAATLGLKFSSIETYLESGWFCMGGVTGSSVGSTCFSQNRETASKESFKGMATDLLLVIPVLEQMVATVIQPTGKLTGELDTFFDVRHDTFATEAETTISNQRCRCQVSGAVANTSFTEIYRGVWRGQCEA